MSHLRITNGTVLLDGDGFVATDVLLRDGLIAKLDAGADAQTLDATGLLVLPGIVDIHGDAFERQLQPRPGIGFPTDLALQDTEAQLLANGITTAYHGVTLSWEPGLRSVQAWQHFLAALAARAWTCDMRVHLRWEAYNLAALDHAVADIAAGRVHMLAFNDHTPAILRKLQDPVEGAKYSERAGMKLAAFRVLADRVATRADEISAAQESLATAARAIDIPMASHDDDHIDTRARFRALGAQICEFPVARDAAANACAAGEWVVMGSPNVVRGGSHLGWASAAEQAEAGVCSILASDYFYPAMLRAAFVLADRGVLGLADAWALISANPAAAAQLPDRGRIAPGLRADVVLVDPRAKCVVATLVGGELAYLGPSGRTRLG